MMQQLDIPCGWLTKRLSYLIKSMDAGVSVNSEDRKADFGECGILKTSAVTSGVFDADENKAILASEVKRAKISPTCDRIIMSRMNTPALVGANAYVPQTVSNLFLPDRLWLLTPKEGRVNMRWLAFVLGSPKYRSKLSSFATGTSNSMKNITKGDVASLPVLLPPLPEQKAIADLLSTWNKTIEKTERLIQAKETRFKRLLHDLIYLPTKEGKWKQIRTKSLFKERKENKRGDLPLLSITNGEGVIPREDTNRKDTSNEDKSKYLRICPGDIGYNTMRMWQGVSALSSLEGIVSPAYTICIPGEKLCPLFVAYLFKMPFMIHRFYRYSQGLTSDTWNLKFPHFSEVKMPLPSIDEQEQIAETLSAARREIDLLKQLAEKYKTQKRGLMQKMLTGEWRVKPEIVNQYMEA
jgi:type I restriction enzyme S subunit